MVVELRKTEKQRTLDYLYSYDQDSLTKFTDYSYGFPENSKCVLEIEDKEFHATQIHITPKLHKGQHSNEMVIEHEHYNIETRHTEKAFICFFLQHDSFTNDIEFPLDKCPLDKLMIRCSKGNLYYQTRNEYSVLVCTDIIKTKSKIPQHTRKAKTVYKELMEPDVFDVIRSIITLQDNSQTRVIDAIADVKINKKLYNTTNQQEGFEGKENSGSYMECVLLDDDGEEEVAEYAVTSLSANQGQRWITLLIHTFQALLFMIIFGLALPSIISSSTSPALKIGYDIVMLLFALISIVIGLVLTTTKDLDSSKKARKEIEKITNKVIPKKSLTYALIFLMFIAITDKAGSYLIAKMTSKSFHFLFTYYCMKDGSSASTTYEQIMNYFNPNDKCPPPPSSS